MQFNRKYDSLWVIRDWFQRVQKFKAEYGILDEDTYNFDESRFMIGMISTGAVVTGANSQQRPKTLQQGNHEWVTAIQGIGATGWAIPPFLIFAGSHHPTTWYTAEDLPRDWVIAVFENGRSSDQLTFD